MPRNALSLVKRLIGHFNYLDNTRKSLDHRYYQGLSAKRDIDQTYKGLFVECYASFEQFLEDLFVGILTKSVVHPSNLVVPKLVFNSHRMSREVIYGGRNYIDWLPYDRHTKKRSMIYFRRGLPFTSLDDGEIQLLKEVGYIRNAIVHLSRHAQKRFQNNVIGAASVTLGEKTIAGYLRGVFRISPRQNRYEYYIIGMAHIAQKLCS